MAGGAAAGALVVSLGLEGAEYFSGLNKAELASKKLEQQAAKLAKSIDREVAALQQSADKLSLSAREAKLYELALAGATKAQLESADAAIRQAEAFEATEKATAKLAELGKVALAAVAVAAVAAVVAFDQLVKGAADFVDLSEETGASAEDMASFALAAAGAGVEMRSLADAMISLNKKLVGVEDASKPAGAALRALGLNIKEFKALDPAAQYEAVGQALGGFADGAGKTAVATTLMGKAGTEQLKVFKALEDQGGRQVILTQELLTLADAYADSQVAGGEKLQVGIATLKLYAQAAATLAVPAVNALTGAAIDLAEELFSVDVEALRVGGNSAVVEWSEKAAYAIAAFADSLIDTGREIAAFVASTKVEFANLKIIAAYVKTALPGQGSAGRDDLAAAYEERSKAQAAAADAYAASAAKNSTKVQDAVRKQFSAMAFAKTASSFGGGPDSRPKLPDDPTKTDKKAKAASGSSEAQKYLDNLDKQIEKTLQLSVYEQALLDTRTKGLKGLTPGLEAQILAQARLIDLNKQTKDLRDAETAVVTRRAQAELDALDAMVKGNEGLQKEIDLLGLNAEGLAEYEIQKVRVARAEKEATLAALEATGVAEQQLQVLQAEIAALQQREALIGQKLTKSIDVDAAADAAKAADNLLKKAADDAERFGQSVQDNLGDAFADFITGSKTAGDAFKSFATSVVNELVRIQAQKLAASILGESGGLGGFAGMLSGLFGGSSAGTGVGTNLTGGSLPTAGGAATGTNFVERDMLTILHKGEAVTPKAFNPSNPSAHAATMQASAPQIYVNVKNEAGDVAQASAQQADDGSVEVLIKRVSQQIGSDVARGRGPVAQGMRARGVSMNGNLPRVG